MEHPQIRGLSEWRPLARGGLAVVWEARQLSLGRLIAVKVYQNQLDEGGRRRFLREAAAAGRLSNHPGIVTTHDAGILPDNRPYLIMELYSSGSLSQWLKAENRPNEEAVRQVGVRIADALAAAHARGVLHRDVKPANILIDSYGNPALADFGLAAVAGAETAAEALGVTPAYAPPEVFAMQPATAAGDVFSLAATLYALIAGSPPRGVGAAPIALEQMVEAAKKPIGQLPWVNWYLMDALMTALSNDPGARPTAAQFRDQLANVPTPRMSRRGLHVPAADTAAMVPSRGSVVAGLATASNSNGAAATVATVDPQPAASTVASTEAPRRQGRRRRGALALAAALVTVVGSGTVWLISEPASSGVSEAITQSAHPGGPPNTGTSFDARPPATTTQVIQLTDSADSAKPFQTVRYQGTYLGGADTILHVQRWDGAKWEAFPIPAKTDQSGQFTAFVELGKPGQYRLRVVDPGSGVTSTPFVLVIEG